MDAKRIGSTNPGGSEAGADAKRARVSGGAEEEAPPPPSRDRSLRGGSSPPPPSRASLEGVANIIALQFVAMPDGRPLRDQRGVIIPAWPEVADALLSVASTFASDDVILRAAVNVAHGPNGLTRLMASVAVRDLARTERLLALGADVNAAVLLRVPGITRKGGTALVISMHAADAFGGEDDDFFLSRRDGIVSALLAAGARVDDALHYDVYFKSGLYSPKLRGVCALLQIQQ